MCVCGTVCVCISGSCSSELAQAYFSGADLGLWREFATQPLPRDAREIRLAPCRPISPGYAGVATTKDISDDWRFPFEFAPAAPPGFPDATGNESTLNPHLVRRLGMRPLLDPGLIRNHPGDDLV